MSVRVMLVDDHASMRAGLSMVLASDPEIDVVAEAGNGAEAVRVARERRPDLVFLDVEMPGWNGVRTTAELLRVLPEVRILVLTMFDLDEYVAGAMQAGAHGFLLKTADARELIAAVHACAAGEAVLTPEVLSRVAAHFVRSHSVRPREGLDRLTEREREVLALMCQGLSNGEIAARLVVELATVKSHVAHILQKLAARDRLQAVVMAYRAGLA
ncbi:DNA-binding response regulator [Ornithinimicrobium sp. CNJ-824]|uniref:response regulator n=1 Tax=Ornithinimicrobium sp. CNJ-824 TaxID=1904966 RepID=UPI000965659D|nr:response regulator transcription factor [Ornithinimicrobium sp. CNJ-824]OLT23692.1 DNA-binding response regulator [Ornithinimicrobium sp. CNJ-824]